MTARGRWVGVGLVCAMACTSPTTSPLMGDSGSTDGVGQSDGIVETTDVTDVMEPFDDAQMVSTEFPDAMGCDESLDVTVTVRNSGTTTWTRDGLYKLGTVDDDDPLHGDATRVYFSETDVVAPGEDYTFTMILTAPSSNGSYITDWQMVREKVHWFGETAAFTVLVTCDEPPPLDLSQVTWLHADVSGWAETAHLDSVYIAGDDICLDYDKSDVWPIFDYNGTDVVGNPWIFIWYDKQWYGATWEWLRPEQICKAKQSVAGDHIKQDPFGTYSGWVPTSGVTYYFMVSGLARDSNRTVEERTQPVPFVWP